MIQLGLLAFLWSLQKFEHYVYGRQVTVFSDHYPLAYLALLARQPKASTMEFVAVQI